MRLKVVLVAVLAAAMQSAVVPFLSARLGLAPAASREASILPSD